MSNLTFLKTDWPGLFTAAREAEQNVNSALRTSCFNALRSLEQWMKWQMYVKKILLAYFLQSTIK